MMEEFYKQKEDRYVKKTMRAYILNQKAQVIRANTEKEYIQQQEQLYMAKQQAVANDATNKNVNSLIGLLNGNIGKGMRKG